MADTNEHEVIELDDPFIDATDLIIDETVDDSGDDDSDYDELIVLDLRKAAHHDAWMC